MSTTPSIPDMDTIKAAALAAYSSYYVSRGEDGTIAANGRNNNHYA